MLRTKALPVLEKEAAAVMLSLPYALLMWRWAIYLLCYHSPLSHLFPQYSMVSFLVAFLHLCFENSDTDTLTFSLIGSLSGVIAVLTSEKSLSFEEYDGSEERPKNFIFEVVPEHITEKPQSSVLGITRRFSLLFDWRSFFRLPRRTRSHNTHGTVIDIKALKNVRSKLLVICDSCFNLKLY